ncbi:hypothetical protein ACJMK2_031752 [Sinanodonta woodiana]|uniref:Uncharacterized protein n=1 Tax=Sinanodonta woodiana TaxID=1069815 RepID=A0ABD3WZQ7_SINWO
MGQKSKAMFTHSRADIGFPIVEVGSDGNFILYKPLKTGGLISKATVSEQLVYELDDPSHYFLPDVVCDFTNVKISEVKGHDGGLVYVSGARGNPPAGEFKVSATYADGFRATAVAVVAGPRSKAKAEKTAEQIIKRCRKIFNQLGLQDFSKVHIEVLGSEHMYGANSRVHVDVREAVLWLAVHHSQRKALEFFAREVAPAGTGMGPGLTAVVGGRPRVSPVLKLFSFLYPKHNIKVQIYMNGEFVEDYVPPQQPTAEYPNKGRVQEETVFKEPLPTGPHTFRLEELAYTRSGDKGNTANIGVIARHPDILPYLQQALTAKAVEAYFAHLFENRQGPIESRIQRFDVPGIHAMNFVLYNSLGGGGIASLRSDPQGKALGQMLLDFEIKNLPNLVALLGHRS